MFGPGLCARCREEKEFGFRGTEGRLLLLQVCEVRIQIAQDQEVCGRTHLGGMVTVPGSQLLRHRSLIPPACRVLPPGGPLYPAAHGAAPGTGDWLVSQPSNGGVCSLVVKT